ncbi:hypothetical protein AC249_AIPGENE2060 [Exaiptasia diaphana]|nr:hypothetical protein AC249_AIPGENE2060 [Exaiptasia diaphana]
MDQQSHFCKTIITVSNTIKSIVALHPLERISEDVLSDNKIEFNVNTDISSVKMCTCQRHEKGKKNL